MIAYSAASTGCRFHPRAELTSVPAQITVNCLCRVDGHPALTGGSDGALASAKAASRPFKGQSWSRASWAGWGVL